MTKMPPTSLDKLPLGQSARIARVRVQGAERRRLLDLGFMPGATIKPVLRNPLGGPRGFELMGGVVAIRATQAELVDIELLGPCDSVEAGT